EPEPLAHGGELLGIDVAGLVAAEDQEGHVPGDHAHDQEDQGRGPEERGNDQEKSLQDVRAHAAVTRLGSILRQPDVLELLVGEVTRRRRSSSRSQSSASQTSWSFWFV